MTEDDYKKMPENFGKTREVFFNYIGAVDAGDWGTKVFNLGDLFSRDELEAAGSLFGAAETFELQLAVEIVTENTGGAHAVRARVRRVGPGSPLAGDLSRVFRKLDEVGQDPNHPTHAVAREAILAKMASADPKPRPDVAAALEAIRDAYAWGKVLHLGDLELLIELATDDYDTKPADVASNVRALLLDDDVSRFLPGASVPPPKALRPPPLGKVVRVDVYECDADQLRVKVERVPGADPFKVEAHMEAEDGDPTCPVCEREMVVVERKLRRVR